MTINLVQLWGAVTPIVWGLSLALWAMALALVVITVERLLVFARSSEQSRAFASVGGKLVEARQFEDLVQLAARYDSSFLAGVFGAVAGRFLDALKETEDSAITPLESARNESARRSIALRGELRRGVAAVATIGSVAPWIGVLAATVALIGACEAFASGPVSVAAIFGAAAGALVHVAFGFALAITAKVASSYLEARLVGVESALACSASELLDELAKLDGARANSPASPERTRRCD